MDVSNIQNNSALIRRNDSARDTEVENLPIKEGACCISKLEKLNVSQTNTQKEHEKDIDDKFISDSKLNGVQEYLNRDDNHFCVGTERVPSFEKQRIKNMFWILNKELENSHRAMINFLDVYMTYSKSRELCISLLKKHHGFISDSLKNSEKNSHRIQASNIDLGENQYNNEWLTTAVSLFRGTYDILFGRKISKNDIRSEFFEVRESLQKDNYCVCELYYKVVVIHTKFEHTRNWIQDFLKENKRTSWEKDDFEDEYIFNFYDKLSKCNPNHGQEFYSAFKLYLNELIREIKENELNSEELKIWRDLTQEFKHSIIAIDYLPWAFDNQNFNNIERKIKYLNVVDYFTGDQNFSMELYVSKIENIILCLEEEEIILKENVMRLCGEKQRVCDILSYFLGRDKNV